MTVNGIGGFQRAEARGADRLRPRPASRSMPAGSPQPDAVPVARRRRACPTWSSSPPSRPLGEDGRAPKSSREAWRDRRAARSSPIRRCCSGKYESRLPVSNDLAVGLCAATASPSCSRLPNGLARERQAGRALRPRLPHPLRRDRPAAGRHLGRAQGLDADDAGHARARLPDRRAGGALSRGIRAAEPLDRPDRGLDQQPRRRAFDHLRPARPGGVPQRSSPAALGPAGRRHDAGADDACRSSSSPGATRSRPCRRRSATRALARRRVADADRVPPRPAAGPARHPDRHDHRHGPRARRDRAAADDRHARLRRRRRPTASLRPPRVLPVQIFLWSDEIDRGFVERTSRGDHRAAGVPAGDERPGHLPAQPVREDAGESRHDPDRPDPR